MINDKYFTLEFDIFFLFDGQGAYFIQITQFPNRI